MTTYILFESMSQNSLSFQPESSSFPLESDAREIWRVDASTWEAACLKRNIHLGWEPYKPQITSEQDLLNFLPIDKHDLDNAQLLINLGFPTVKPVLPRLFEWIQDINWPVAKVILPFLASLGGKCEKEIQTVFQSNDGMWKYWVISELIGSMPNEEEVKFLPLLQKLRENLSPNDVAEEVNLAIDALLEKLSVE